MDLKISGRKAIVCGASAGLGRGAARALALDGVDVLIAARTEDRLRRAAEEIAAEAGRPVRHLAVDVTTEEGRLALLEACPEPDILINNAGGPPTGDFREWGRETWIRAIEANMLSGIFLIRATIDGMIARRWGRIVNITSSMVKAPAGYLGLSNGARAGLTGFVGGLSRDVAQHGVTINNVLPGQFDTDRLRSNHQRAAETSGRDFDTVRAGAIRQIPAGRLGQPDEFGAMCAFLCSEHAAFITGQNILLDGGQFPGLL
ncbi:MAG TPA: SDR family oxidoreductase [Caulobacteraceae bacterium]